MARVEGLAEVVVEVGGLVGATVVELVAVAAKAEDQVGVEELVEAEGPVVVAAKAEDQVEVGELVEVEG